MVAQAPVTTVARAPAATTVAPAPATTVAPAPATTVAQAPEMAALPTPSQHLSIRIPLETAVSPTLVRKQRPRSRHRKTTLRTRRTLIRNGGDTRVGAW